MILNVRQYEQMMPGGCKYVVESCKSQSVLLQRFENVESQKYIKRNYHQTFYKKLEQKCSLARRIERNARLAVVPSVEAQKVELFSTTDHCGFVFFHLFAQEKRKASRKRPVCL